MFTQSRGLVCGQLLEIVSETDSAKLKVKSTHGGSKGEDSVELSSPELKFAVLEKAVVTLDTDEFDIWYTSPSSKALDDETRRHQSSQCPMPNISAHADNVIPSRAQLYK